MASPGNDSTGERVLAVPRGSLEDADLLLDGFREGRHHDAFRVVARSASFLPRDRAEDDPGWKQIIPYAVVRSGDKVLLLRRTARGGEPRLHDLYSVGVGGHINPVEGAADALGLIEAGLRRELAEELCWRVDYEFRPLGTLNDDANLVGRVHFGIAYLVETPSPDVYVRETDLLEGRFVDVEELRARLGEMETWSQHLVSALLGAGAWNER